jgi:hypothetical protein
MLTILPSHLTDTLYHTHVAAALLLFLFFVVFAGFYMMSMVLGLVGDLFAEESAANLLQRSSVLFTATPSWHARLRGSQGEDAR